MKQLTDPWLLIYNLVISFGIVTVLRFSAALQPEEGSYRFKDESQRGDDEVRVQKKQNERNRPAEIATGNIFHPVPL